MEIKMELIGYDNVENISTIKLSDEEFVDINSILWYIASTFSEHDKALLSGVDEARLKNIRSKMDIILDGIGKAKGLQK